MGFLTGTVSTGGQPAVGVTLDFRKSGYSQGTTISGAGGSYTSPNLAAGIYTVFKTNPTPEAQCDCDGDTTFNVPTAGLVTKNLEY
ncbi:carboxypeptidase-like regulatory domain-containing protein [bacterium]|nr:carboxypeptidase-like regulatory domain-containing protein [bacterium]